MAKHLSKEGVLETLDNAFELADRKTEDKTVKVAALATLVAFLKDQGTLALTDAQATEVAS